MSTSRLMLLTRPAMPKANSGVIRHFSATPASFDKKRRFLDFNPNPENPEQEKNLAAFKAMEADLAKGLNLDKLNPEQKAIHFKHLEAIQNWDMSYEEPGKEGLKVFTRLRHFVKGGCCGSACRHCVYGHEKVKPEKKAQRQFNTSFWEDIPGLEK